MAPAAPHTIEPRQATDEGLGNDVRLSIGARRGNFYKSSANYSCGAMQGSWSGAVGPATISLYSGARLPDSFFTNPPPTNSSAVNDKVKLIDTVRNVTDSSGSFEFSVDELNVGAYVGLAITDSVGNFAFSELRTVYEGTNADDECRAVIDSPTSSRDYTLPKVGSFAVNVYKPSTEFNCTMPIEYSGSYTPLKVEVFNASGLPQRFFAGDTYGIDVPVLGTVAQDVRYTMGTVYWNTDLPAGSRIGWKVTDARGQTGYSESRTVYNAGPSSQRTCQLLLEASKPDTGGSGSHSIFRNGSEYGLAVAVIFVVGLSVYMCTCSRTRFNRFKRRRRGVPSSSLSTSHSYAYDERSGAAPTSPSFDRTESTFKPRPRSLSSFFARRKSSSSSSSSSASSVRMSTTATSPFSPTLPRLPSLAGGSSLSTSTTRSSVDSSVATADEDSDYDTDVVARAARFTSGPTATATATTRPRPARVARPSRRYAAHPNSSTVSPSVEPVNVPVADPEVVDDLPRYELSPPLPTYQQSTLRSDATGTTHRHADDDDERRSNFVPLASGL